MNITEAFSLYDSRVLALKKMKTRKNYRCAYRSLVNATGDIPIELVCEETITVWMHYMREQGCTGTTQRGYIISLRRILQYFRDKGMNLYDMSPVELPAIDTAPRVFLKATEVERLLKATRNPRDKAIVACTFIAGCRISELLNLDRGDVDIDIDEDGLQEVSVCGKGDKYRPVIFNETARAMLNAYLDTRTDRFKPLFISGQNRRITVSRVEQIIHRCARDAGLEKVVTPHTLRHSYATDLLINGAPLYDVSKSMGHKNITTTSNIYGHYDTAARKSAALKHQTKINVTP